jgi:NADH-quinone oxidoreductase subunit H
MASAFFMILAGCLILLVLVLTVAAFLVWAERKVAARIQDRLGPTRVGGRFGWLQSVADGIKMLAKEDIIPMSADRILFRLAPYLGFTAAFSWFVLLPFSEQWVMARVEVGVLLLVAIAGLEIYAVLLGGYASGSKWSLIGAMREAVQVVSYEIPLALCLLLPVIVGGSMDLVSLVRQQAGGIWNWYIFHDPFLFLAFWVYSTCAVASLNRAPFDLPEAESELVSGYMTEYSGFRWGVLMLSEYVAMFAVAGLGSALFLGGWYGPAPLAIILGWPPPGSFIAQVVGSINFLIKALLGVLIMMWARWTLPRLRIDQVMSVCLKYCLPLAVFAFFGCLIWQACFPEGILRLVR